jgi:hypothetical protein
LPVSRRTPRCGFRPIRAMCAARGGG